nr:unnamed protein product [Callosobruchus chinensis]
MHTRNFLFSPQGGRLHTSRTERYDRTFIPRVPGPGMDCLVMY